MSCAQLPNKFTSSVIKKIPHDLDSPISTPPTKRKLLTPLIQNAQSSDEFPLSTAPQTIAASFRSHLALAINETLLIS
jgi:hypothetical protein